MLKTMNCLTLVVLIGLIIFVNEVENSNERIKRHHYNPHNWGPYYEHPIQQSSYDYHFNYHKSYDFDFANEYNKPDTHYGLPSSRAHNGHLFPQFNNPGQYRSPMQNPFQPQYNTEFTHLPHTGYTYFPGHQNNGQLNYPGQSGLPSWNPWQNKGQPDVTNVDVTGIPVSPNENINNGVQTGLPIAESLVGPLRRTQGDRLGASINSSIFGTDFNISNVTISPSGVLVEDGGIDAFSFVIDCDIPFEAPPVPDFRSENRRISEVRCFEYVWQLNIRVRKESWDRQCDKNDSVQVKPLILGVTARPEEFPHMAALGWNGVNGDLVFKCGATLISDNYLLTAAHCTSSRPDPMISDLVPRMARVGTTNIAYKATGGIFTQSKRRRRQASYSDLLDVGIINIITHENYDPNRRYFDIALMQLEYNLKFSKNLQPACLWIDMNTSSRIKKAIASGWGVTETGRQSFDLQAGELDIIDTNRCNELLSSSFGNKFSGFADHQVCAGKLSGGLDVCQGDSGGPLQVKIQLPVTGQGSMHTILGVISSGVGCARPNTPGIYTRVTSFVDWIESKIWT